MKILLVFPQIEHGVTTVKDKKRWASILLGYPAITLPHLAALVPRKHDVEIINENYDDLDFNADVDLVGITCLTMTSKRVYEIADEFRKRGKTVILGGFHPSALPMRQFNMLTLLLLVKEISVGQRPLRILNKEN